MDPIEIPILDSLRELLQKMEHNAAFLNSAWSALPPFDAVAGGCLVVFLVSLVMLVFISQAGPRRRR